MCGPLLSSTSNIFYAGTRVHTIDDFGFVVLDIDWLFPRDSGEFMCRATNRWGSDTTKATLKIKGEKIFSMSLTRSRANVLPLLFSLPFLGLVYSSRTSLSTLLVSCLCHFQNCMLVSKKNNKKLKWALFLFLAKQCLTVVDLALKLNCLGYCGKGCFFPLIYYVIIIHAAKKDIIMDSQLPKGMSMDKLRDLEYPVVHEQPQKDEEVVMPRYVKRSRQQFMKITISQLPSVTSVRIKNP